MGNDDRSAERLINEQEAADQLGISKRTLIRWRLAGKGPVHTRAGAQIRYAPSSLRAWVEAASPYEDLVARAKEANLDPAELIRAALAGKVEVFSRAPGSPRTLVRREDLERVLSQVDERATPARAAD